MARIAVAILFALGLLAGCATTEDFAHGWVGEPIVDFLDAMHRPDTYASRTGWKEQKYQLKNGNWVYVSPNKEGCLVHWEVDKRGVIVGYRLEGAKC
jgi:hypothetical protein